ncbi:MAG: putative Ig domain-containing protein [Proteobacteria bacterium]|nr:putative Ig domain-containing protein [Pseudomonadota bacterium]
MTFSAANLPSWLSISSSTGLVSGTPSSGNVGTYANIVISVSDGKSSAHMPAFSIAVSQAGTASGSATLTWSMPTQNADGTPLTDLTGFVIRYGQSPTSLTQQINIDNPSVNTYTIANLTAGTWYFAVVTMSAGGNYSSPTNVASKTI